MAEMEEDASVLIQAQDAAVNSEVVQGEELHALEAAHGALQKTLKKLREAELKLDDELQKAESSLRTFSSEVDACRSRLEIVRKEHTQEQVEYNADVRAVLLNLRQNNAASSGSVLAAEAEEEVTIELLADLSEELLESSKGDLEDLKKELDQLERAKNAHGNVDRTALMDWIKKNGLYRLKLAELEAVTLERNAARKEFESLRGQRLEMFMGGFGVITLKLKEMYQMITLGGDAELELLDSLDPFSEGIVFSVRPPKKSWKNISNLSGGEKTLSSLALVFALHHYKPTPLYVMDEIDAALVSTMCTAAVWCHVLTVLPPNHTYHFQFLRYRISRMFLLLRITSRNALRTPSSSLSVSGS
jgi:structural maintenance of chromosome 4